MKACYIAPVVTALDKDGGFDCEALKGIYDRIIRGGVNGILILGSIGEFFGFSMDRKKELIRLAAGHIKKRTKLIVGTAGMIASETVELSNYAYEQGAHAVIVVSPFYFGLSDRSIEAYYDFVAENCRGDIYLYNFPDRTGYDISPDITLNLLRKHSNIVGYKDTVAGMDHTRELIKLIKPEFPHFEIYSGFDNNFAHNLLSGGDGCIGGLANLSPELCAEWVRAFEENDLQRITSIQRTVDKLMGIYNIGKPFVPHIKLAMKLIGIHIEDYCTFPMCRVTQQEELVVKQILESAHIL